MQKVTYISWVSGSKWEKIETYLKTLAWKLYCDIENHSDKGWFNEKVSYKVTGEERFVKMFKAEVIKTVTDYNKNS